VSTVFCFLGWKKRHPGHELFVATVGDLGIGFKLLPVEFNLMDKAEVLGAVDRLVETEKFVFRIAQGLVGEGGMVGNVRRLVLTVNSFNQGCKPYQCLSRLAAAGENDRLQIVGSQ